MKVKKEESQDYKSLQNVLKAHIKNGENTFLETLIVSMNVKAYYLPELLQAAAYFNNTGAIRLLLSRGCSLAPLPAIVVNEPNDVMQKFVPGYRPAPYIVFAASNGYLDFMDLLVNMKQSINEKGHMGYSPTRKNSVVSNCFGAAAFHCQLFALKWMLKSFHNELQKEFRAEERRGAGTGTLKDELSGCTPLLLCLTKGDSSVDVVKWMIHDAKCDPGAVDAQGNSAIHLAVRYNCIEILNFLLSETKVSPFERNVAGETPAIMAKKLKLQRVSEILDKLDDGSDQKMQELMSIIEEEERQKQESQKQKETKKASGGKKKRKPKAKAHKKKPGTEEEGNPPDGEEKASAPATAPAPEHVSALPSKSSPMPASTFEAKSEPAPPPEQPKQVTSPEPEPAQNHLSTPVPEEAKKPEFAEDGTQTRTKTKPKAKQVEKLAQLTKELQVASNVVRYFAVSQIELLEHELQSEQERKTRVERGLYQRIFAARPSRHNPVDGVTSEIKTDSLGKLEPVIMATPGEVPEYGAYRRLFENRENMRDLLELANEEVRNKDRLLHRIREVAGGETKGKLEAGDETKKPNTALDLDAKELPIANIAK